MSKRLNSILLIFMIFITLGSLVMLLESKEGNFLDKTESELSDGYITFTVDFYDSHGGVIEQKVKYGTTWAEFVSLPYNESWEFEICSFIGEDALMICYEKTYHLYLKGGNNYVRPNDLIIPDGEYILYASHFN